MTSNSKQNRQKNRTLKDEKLVPPTKKKKIESRLLQTYIEQNNDHVRITHKIQFRSSLDIN